jgi:hypothetical protein
MTATEVQPEQIHKIKTYTTNQFVDKLHEHFDPFPKTIHVFFNIDSLKKSVIDVCFVKQLLFVFETGKLNGSSSLSFTKKFINAKDLNDKLNHEMLFLNLRKGIEHKLKQLKHQFYSLNITMDKQKHDDFDYYPTTISYINDKNLIDKIKLADEELFDVVEFKL